MMYPTVSCRNGLVQSLNIWPPLTGPLTHMRPIAVFITTANPTSRKKMRSLDQLGKQTWTPAVAFLFCFVLLFTLTLIFNVV